LGLVDGDYVFLLMFYAFSTYKAFLFMPLFAIYLYIIVARKANLSSALTAGIAVGEFLALQASGSFGGLIGGAFTNKIPTMLA
jgi:hypothetical protein